MFFALMWGKVFLFSIEEMVYEEKVVSRYVLEGAIFEILDFLDNLFEDIEL